MKISVVPFILKILRGKRDNTKSKNMEINNAKRNNTETNPPAYFQAWTALVNDRNGQNTVYAA
jgi:hypothetical protein